MINGVPSRPTILYVGEPIGDPFGHVLHWLRQRADVRIAVDLSAAKRCFADLQPLLVILTHGYPGQFPTGTDVEIMRRFPLCRVIHLLHEWCAGEMRGDRPSPGTSSVHWHQWRARFEAEWQLWQRGECPGWGMALTAFDEERFASRGSYHRGCQRFAIGIVTACRESSRALSDAVQAIGFHCRTLSNLESDNAAELSLVLWDEARAPRAAAIPLRQVVRQVSPVPVIALTSFTRVTEIEAARQAGAVEMLAKPYLLPDLSWLLHRHIPSVLAEAVADAPAA